MGTQFSSCGGADNLREQFNALRADVAAIHAAMLAFTAKLDTDAVAQNSAVTSSQLDVDYATAVDPAAITSADLTAGL